MYSKIKAMYIKNFKNLGEVEIDFTKSPIIALKGNNDAGKSSVIDAFAVAVYNANETHQKDFIKLGTVGFGVKIVLEDGTEVTRLKKANLNFYEVKHPDGTVWNTDKLIRGEGVPSEVEAVMGCTREPETKEFLHIRTYNDLMLFINTPNSVNYKVMYDALKVENISKAIKKGSVEANELKAWLNNASIQRETLLRTLEGIKIIDIEPVTSVRDRLIKSAGCIKKMTDVEKIMGSIRDCELSLGGYNEVYESGIDTVDTGYAMVLGNVHKCISDIENAEGLLNKYSGISEIEQVDLSKVQKVYRAVQCAEEISSRENELLTYNNVDKLEIINDVTLGKLSGAVDTVNKLSRLNAEFECYLSLGDTVDQQLVNKLYSCVNLIEKIKTLNVQLKECESIENESKIALVSLGVKVVTCDKCGNDIIIDSNNNDRVLGNGGGCCE